MSAITPNISSQFSAQDFAFVNKDKIKIVSKLCFLSFSTGIGYAIAYPGTIPNWDNSIVVITNVGVLLAYGTLGTWGIFMSGQQALAYFQGNTQKKSCCQIAGKVAQVFVSLVSGAFAQFPIFEISKEFNGLAWAIPTEVFGSLVPGYSEYMLIEEFAKGINTFLFSSKLPTFCRVLGTKNKFRNF